MTACAAACVVTDGELCIECLGPSYHQCVSCFKVADEINALVTLQGEQYTLITLRIVHFDPFTSILAALPLNVLFDLCQLKFR